jgi:coenzyme PQQ precursor peptide PqqA
LNLALDWTRIVGARPEEMMNMQWETPAFTEIDMSAEIGAYQSDFDQERRGDEPGYGPATSLPEQA